MKPIKRSLAQLLGVEFMETVCLGAAVFHDLAPQEARELANEEVYFMPEGYIAKMDLLLEKVGQQIIPEHKIPFWGAPTEAFKRAFIAKASPVGGLGYLRLGEDGRLYLISKSEHYHASLGHAFPGFKLIDNARRLGIPNATHNNTRGYITRFLESELIRAANLLPSGDTAALRAVLESQEPRVLNRVINLETGSLAVEAGIKMMLARFYRLESTFPAPKYHDRIPVFFVIADNEGGRKANYHGTTVIAQTMRDLWPDFYQKLSSAGLYEVCPIQINDIDDFRRKFAKYNMPPYKAAGFLHEIVLMNYGGIRLEEAFLKEIYETCHHNDTPTLCDEIQSCMWYRNMFLFTEYGLDPDFVIIGKGFPGGEYAASKILTTYEMDNLNQFGALVTNGQEELASLAYLITMTFAQENAALIEENGGYYEARLRELAAEYTRFIDKIEGKGHLMAILFKDPQQVTEFTKTLNAWCIDISAQTYKSKCPPAALTKIPLIATRKMIDYLIGKIKTALEML